MNTHNSSPLSPEQAADVIRYYDVSDNDGYHEQGWTRRKVSLGRIALRTASSKHSILPDKTPMLTQAEAVAGLEYLESPTWPVEPTDDQWSAIEALVDKRSIPYDEAYYQVMGVIPKHWK